MRKTEKKIETEEMEETKKWSKLLRHGVIRLGDNQQLMGHGQHHLKKNVKTNCNSAWMELAAKPWSRAIPLERSLQGIVSYSGARYHTLDSRV